MQSAQKSIWADLDKDLGIVPGQCPDAVDWGAEVRKLIEKKNFCSCNFWNFTSMDPSI